MPYGLVEETLLAQVFPKGHPYSWSVIGSMKDLNSASLDDLRRSSPSSTTRPTRRSAWRATSTPNDARALIDSYFGPAGRRATPWPWPGGRPSPGRHVELADEVKLPRIHWVWPTVADDHPDAPALDLLATVLAGGETSRLYKTLVRDLRLAKDVSADNDTKEIAGLFTLQVDGRRGQDDRRDRERVPEGDRPAAAEPPSPAEMARVLARIETAF